MRTVYFHEDEYCQIEAVCDENFEWCVDETRRVDEFANAHRDGDSWTAMYMRPGHPVKLATRQIEVEAFAEVVRSHLLPYEAVKTGYSTHVEDSPNTLAFGTEADIAIFAEHRDGRVSAIWFTLQPTAEDQIPGAAAALHALSKWSLLLVDWGWSRVIRLDDEDAIHDYLRQRVQVFGDLQAQFERERQQRKPVEPVRQTRWLTRVLDWIGRSRSRS